jgi:hypothetical protein
MIPQYSIVFRLAPESIYDRLPWGALISGSPCI